MEALDHRESQRGIDGRPSLPSNTGKSQKTARIQTQATASWLAVGLLLSPVSPISPPFFPMPPSWTLGANVSIPIRIFDKNQGEKARTALEITRAQRLRDATEAQVFSDVDSAYATISSNLALLKTYKANYLQRAAQVRDTVLFAYQRGGSSLLDFLQAQQDYRSVQLNYLSLIGSYLAAASQLNLAVGREVIP